VVSGFCNLKGDGDQYMGLTAFSIRLAHQATSSERLPQDRRAKVAPAPPRPDIKEGLNKENTYSRPYIASRIGKLVAREVQPRVR
jgi:hypothetical protein